MDAEVAHDGAEQGPVVLRPTGELDVSSLQPLADEARACQDGAQVVLDLSEVTFLDSSVLAIVAQLHGRCDVSVVGAQGIVRRVFEVSGMDPLLAD